jgi:hypothetical protein
MSFTLSTRRAHFSPPSPLAEPPCRHPDANDLQRDRRADDLAAEAQDVGVRMRACQLGTEGVLAHRGVDSGDLVHDHRAPVADTVDEDPAVDFAARDGEGCRVDVVGEVCGVVGVGAEVADLVSISAQQRRPRAPGRKQSRLWLTLCSAALTIAAVITALDNGRLLSWFSAAFYAAFGGYWYYLWRHGK